MYPSFVGSILSYYHIDSRVVDPGTKVLEWYIVPNGVKKRVYSNTLTLLVSKQCRNLII